MNQAKWAALWRWAKAPCNGPCKVRGKHVRGYKNCDKNPDPLRFGFQRKTAQRSVRLPQPRRAAKKAKKKTAKKGKDGIRAKTVETMLKRLVEGGCGCPPWCNCLLCRVRRVAATEQDRVRSEYGLSRESPSATTKMISWRGGFIEFGRNEEVAQPPWYALKMRRKEDGNIWFWWLDYCGPPQLFLTREAARQKAKELRKQYKGSYKVTVVKVGEL